MHVSSALSLVVLGATSWLACHRNTDIPLPDGALISDDDDYSFISSDKESEGGFGGFDNADYGDVGLVVNIPHEGAQGPNNFATDGKGRCRST